MNRRAVYLGAALMVLASSASCSHATAPLDVGRYTRERGWVPFDTSPPPSPAAGLVPLHYQRKSDLAPTCGLLAQGVDGKPQVLVLAGPDEGEGWPQCTAIESITAFTLDKRDYVAVVYLVQDTREDFYRYVDYVYADPVKGYVTDEGLRSSLHGGLVAPEGGRKTDVIALAQSRREAVPLAPGNFEEQHFMGNSQSWFAVVTDRKARDCRFLVKAAGTPVAFDHARFTPGTRCEHVLATTRFEKGRVRYYLAMFELAGGKRHVAIMSVAPDGHVSADTALAGAISRAGTVKDIRTARAALAKALP
jgi:hypothetical protein